MKVQYQLLLREGDNDYLEISSQDFSEYYEYSLFEHIKTTFLEGVCYVDFKHTHIVLSVRISDIKDEIIKHLISTIRGVVQIYEQNLSEKSKSVNFIFGKEFISLGVEK